MSLLVVQKLGNLRWQTSLGFMPLNEESIEEPSVLSEKVRSGQEGEIVNSRESRTDSVRFVKLVQVRWAAGADGWQRDSEVDNQGSVPWKVGLPNVREAVRMRWPVLEAETDFANWRTLLEDAKSQ